ncbi:MAG: hypothetical protein EOP68_15110 [Sphingomonas sp.]|nr:MAG: hypothetical protein EOP68_15110 [Sphingomonas sp.]
MRARFDLLLVLLTAAGVMLAGLIAPKHNWDMVAYVAAAYAADGHAGPDLLRRTYQDVGGAVDTDSYRDLTAGPYRATVARDPVALEQQLPFYTIRVVYIAAVRVVGRATGSYTRAAHGVTAVFAFLAVLAMGAILMRAGVPALVLPFLVSPVGILYLARIVTPDSMACFASLLLVLALFRPGWAAYALVVLLPAIRSDYLIFSGLAAGLLFLRHDRTRATVALLAAGVVYLALGRASGNYGYLNLLNFTLFGQQPYPARLPISTDPFAYLAAIATHTNYLVSDGIFLLYVIAVTLLWRWREALGDPHVALLLALPTAFATVHFALFPSYDKRFLVSSFFLVTAGILRAAKR